MHAYYEKLKVDPSTRRHKHFQGCSPNMPLGKIGHGIESYSALNNPKMSPVSNLCCRGYMDLNDPNGGRFKKNKSLVRNGQMPSYIALDRSDNDHMISMESTKNL